ncbi:MAG: C39 family peptidase [Coprobacillus sp.]|nr:C39 family peptidase [Coprobacillus sp.]
MKITRKRITKLFILGLFSCASWTPNKLNSLVDSASCDNVEMVIKQEHIDSFLKDSYYVESEQEICDFFGNEFKLYELCPQGYAIYAIKDEASAFIEGSYASNSPFYGNDGEIYYLGLGEYYVKDENNCFVDIITNEKISIDTDSLNGCDIEFRNDVFYKSVEIEDDSNFTSTFSFQMVDDVGDGGGGTPKAEPTTTYQGFTCIKDYEYFKNLTQFPYNELGTCGITALGIIIGYMDEYIDSDYITSENEYLYKSGNGTTDELGDLLFSYGNTLFGLGNKEKGYPMTAVEINSTMNEYLKEETTKDLYKHTKNNYGILFVNTHNGTRKMMDKGIPVILSMTSYYCNYKGEVNTERKNHTVVAYGYNESDDTFLVHLGWDNGYTTAAEIIVSDANIYSYTAFYYES